MSYIRVIPRDLFNEADLLKCLGKIVLDIEDGKLPWLSYHHDGDAFNIVQNESNGAIYCANLQFFARGQTSRLGHASTGLTAVAASHRGAVQTELYVDKNGIDCACVELVPWQGVGVKQPLYNGPIDGNLPDWGKQ